MNTLICALYGIFAFIFTRLLSLHRYFYRVADRNPLSPC